MNNEKKFILEKLMGFIGTERDFYDFLRTNGDLKTNYRAYLITEPIDCDKELNHLPEAYYELGTAFSIMLLRKLF